MSDTRTGRYACDACGGNRRGSDSRRSWFRKYQEQPRSDRHDVKLGNMRRADLAKFGQHPELAVLLLQSGDAELIEDSSTEPFWGIGPDGLGPNRAGRVLMDVRSALARPEEAEYCALGSC